MLTLNLSFFEFAGAVNWIEHASAHVRIALTIVDCIPKLEDKRKRRAARDAEEES